MNCWVVPSATDALAGDTARELSAAAVTVSVLDPVIDAEVAVMITCPVLTLVASPFVTGPLLTVAMFVALELQVTVAVMS